MRTARIGDRTVTAIGCGDLSLAIAAARGVDRRDVERAFTVALELGLSVADIHPGEDDAERLAGEVIRTQRKRDSVVAVTTVPLLAGRDTPLERLPPAYIQTRVETALRNSKLDALPLVQLPLRPSWLASKVWLEIEGTAARLIREGKALAWGARLADDDIGLAASPDSASLSDELRALLAVPWLVSLSVPYSLCARDAATLIAAATAPVPLGPEAPPAVSGPAISSLIVSAFDITTPIPARITPTPARRTSPLAIFARHPLAGGALAGTIGPGVKLAQRDDRNALDAPTLDRVALEVARLSPLVRTMPPAARSTEASRALLDRMEKRDHIGAVTLAELALRYVIDRGAIALPRLHRHTLVTDALIAATSDSLPEHAISWIHDANP